MNTQTIDTEKIKQNTDLTVLAGRYTTLRRESAVEMAGPCPRCGGDDRFHVKADWFFCRQCNTKGGDVIAFMQWLNGYSFPDACAALSGGSMPVVTNGIATPKKQAKQPTYTLALGNAQQIAKTASAALLDSPAGEAGRVYLESRGLYSEAWETFGLGYTLASLPGTWNAEITTHSTSKQSAICIPWVLSSGAIPAIRYRFIATQAYTDTNGKLRTEKQTAQKGSAFAGRLFGGCGLSGPGDGRSLVLTEGEINAMSVWQATSGAVDVLSMGSESAHLSESAIKAIQRYSRVIVWVDRESVAKKCLQKLPGALVFKSPNGNDASDWLRLGVLHELIQELIAKSS